MEPLNPDTHYTVTELTRILGIEYTRFYDYREKLNLLKYIFPSGRIGYAVHYKEFEFILEQFKSYEFAIPEFEQYKTYKRPIIRHFLDANEVQHVLSEIGDPLSIFTIKRYLREKKLPAYALERKYLVPILAIIKKYTLPIDDNLDRIISSAIGENYQFKL